MIHPGHSLHPYLFILVAYHSFRLEAGVGPVPTDRRGSIPLATEASVSEPHQWLEWHQGQIKLTCIGVLRKETMTFSIRTQLGFNSCHFHVQRILGNLCLPTFADDPFVMQIGTGG